MLQPVRTLEMFQKPPSPKTFYAGQAIFNEGDLGDVMYGIIQGEVQMSVNGKVVENLYQGDIFGIGALIHSDFQRTSTAIAVTDTILAFLDRRNFLYAVQETPMFAICVMKSYSNRFRQLKSLTCSQSNEFLP
ncbi:cyclic nucleotide-binding protein [Gloeothece citriformis PCC 7424]|uniref:Cyclic nucleotide-binding protein n=1 Tax=Gloeothece citriformis (strain PCC 7424) TaxID=65393 RepID=B7KKA4_GLOC7|nr:cyclic nucleotide-binding domain-containing protein [Gloeothece citriformis]ACK70989.1 cyclic nucleotide-binding protein [Gloeothece citriformis PCC 7424]